KIIIWDDPNFFLILIIFFLQKEMIKIVI
ncbi:hypothetical protein, partial [Plasmodium yoelii yoelii]